jgi:dinuclear metal center YbgI/SA1388 family protein
MAKLAEIIDYLDGLMDPASFEDHGPNGLQVPGSAEVAKVVTGVSAQLELFERAAGTGAQLVLCHHGLFWDFHSRALTPEMKRRLSVLFEHDISLAGYHLPLDAHPDVGNNALICEALGLERGERFGGVGWVGRSEGGVPFTEFRERCVALFGQEPLVWDAGPDVVHSVGVVSGAAHSSLMDAIALGLDAFITGEPAEHTMADAREGGVHFLACGHYATETFGVRRLGALLEERFAIAHEFVDLPNPV